MITINSISNAKYVRADNSAVELTIDTVELGIVPIGINLNDSDPEPHIIEIKNWIATHQGSISAYVAPPVVPTPIPAEVTTAQAKIALSRLGLLTQVDNALNALTGTQKTEALIAWNSSNHVVRNSQLVAGMQASLGLTNTQIDDLFTLANSINP